MTVQDSVGFASMGPVERDEPGCFNPGNRQGRRREILGQDCRMNGDLSGGAGRLMTEALSELRPYRED